MDSQPQQQVIQLGYEKRRELPGAGEAAIPRLGEGRYLKLPVGGGAWGGGGRKWGQRNQLRQRVRLGKAQWTRVPEISRCVWCFRSKGQGRVGQGLDSTGV